MVLRHYRDQYTKAASLAVFRLLFGTIMAVSILRFWYNEWIEKLYLMPKMHFHYSGFEFVDVPGQWIYFLFLICFVSAVGVAIGWKYRISIFLFFASFTYIELMDKTTYLNHYYFTSIISFILFFLPAHVSYSVDSYKHETIRYEYVPRWTVDILKLMIAIVYIYAGLAKLNYDWIFRAMPLAIWLPTKVDIPLLGALMHERWVHYLFSWGGAIYDISIVFLLLWSRTRFIAFIFVIIFHVLTRLLFPIGMFPYIMIAVTTIFFSPQFHDRFMNYFIDRLPIKLGVFNNNMSYGMDDREGIMSYWHSQFNKMILTGFLIFQIVFPMRYLWLSDNVFWTEQGYRFSWRVMLMEKTGHADFKIVDGKTKTRFHVQNEDFLSAFQQKQMSTQPDFILEYAQFLGQHFSSQGHQNIEVYVDSYAALNGRKSQRYIDPNVDLLTVNYKQLCMNHIIPMNE